MPAVQVSNNVINTLSQGILLGWGNYALDLPYVYGNNINNSFTNNQITGSQISPLTLTSALTASVVNLAMTDVMCGVFGDNTRQFGWETQNTPFNMAYVYGITFSGNSLTTTPNCQRNLANYAVRPSHTITMEVASGSSLKGAVSEHAMAQFPVNKSGSGICLPCPPHHVGTCIT